MAKTALLFRSKSNPNLIESAIVDDEKGLLVDADTTGETDAVSNLSDDDSRDPQKVAAAFKEMNGSELIHQMPLGDDESVDVDELSSYNSDDKEDIDGNSMTRRLYDEWQSKRSPEQSSVPESKANKVIRGIADKMKSESKWFNSGYDPTGIQTSKNRIIMAEEKEKDVAPQIDENAAEEAPKKGNKELFYESIRTNFPDVELGDDDEENYGKANELFGRIKKESDENRSKANKFQDALDADPAAAAAFMSFMEGTPLPTALRKYYDDDELSMKEGDEGYEEYKKAYDDRKAERQAAKERADAFEKNKGLSDEALKEYVKENGLDEEGATKLTDDIMKFMEALGRGEITKEMWGKLDKASRYEKDLEDAHTAGEIAGRNEKIEKQMRNLSGDGLPEAGGNSSEKPEEPKEEDNFMKKIGDRVRSHSKWEQSGFKRI